MKNSNQTIGNRTRDILACSAVRQPTATAPPLTLRCRILYEMCGRICFFGRTSMKDLMLSYVFPMTKSVT